MKYRCPQCSSPLKSTSLLLHATTHCASCGVSVCFASFGQWLLSAVTSLGSLFALLFLLGLKLGLGELVFLGVSTLLFPILFILLVARPMVYRAWKRAVNHD